MPTSEYEQARSACCRGTGLSKVQSRLQQAPESGSQPWRRRWAADCRMAIPNASSPSIARVECQDVPVGGVNVEPRTPECFCARVREESSRRLGGGSRQWATQVPAPHSVRRRAGDDEALGGLVRVRRVSEPLCDCLDHPAACRQPDPRSGISASAAPSRRSYILPYPRPARTRSSAHFSSPDGHEP